VVNAEDSLALLLSRHSFRGSHDDACFC
jgi:hypothetical protein